MISLSIPPALTKSAYGATWRGVLPTVIDLGARARHGAENGRTTLPKFQQQVPDVSQADP
jgi:hypothetical protein